MCDVIKIHQKRRYMRKVGMVTPEKEDDVVVF